MRYVLRIAMLLAVCTSGCVHGVLGHRRGVIEGALPAHMAQDVFEPVVAARDPLVPIDLTWLRQAPAAEHIIDAKDVLGVYIQGVLDVPDQLPAVYFPPQESRSLVQSPSIGHPITVSADGTVTLPLAEPIRVAGMTVAQATAAIRDVYMQTDIISRERGQVSVSLMRPRTARVFVVREDAATTVTTMVRGDAQPLTKRGAAQVLELPIYENDLLTALSETGGLPGIDAYNEVWILRNSAASGQLLQSLQQGGSPDTLGLQPHGDYVRIPLRVPPGSPAPFAAGDVILQDGDIVFLQSREIEYFLTGGLIRGGKFPMPRDHDLDIFEAIAIANTSSLGPSGNATATNFRSGPGNIVAPTDAIVLRQLPEGDQVKIHVDLRVAMNDRKERLKILPKDMIVLRYKPSELMANIALNFVNFGFAIPN